MYFFPDILEECILYVIFHEVLARGKNVSEYKNQ